MFWWFYITIGIGVSVGAIERSIKPTEALAYYGAIVWMFILGVVFWPMILGYYLVKHGH